MVGMIDAIGINPISIFSAGTFIPTPSLEFLEAPEISGTPEEDQTLTASTGTLVSTPEDVEYAYQWFRNGVLVEGATTNEYLVTVDDLGTDITVRVTATSATEGSGSAFSDPVSVDDGEADPLMEPMNLSAPLILGDLVVGETLTIDEGEWDDGGDELSFAYRWFRDDVEMPEVVTSTYELIEDDAGAALKVEVIATNSVGFAVAESDPTGVVTPAASAPVNLVLPTITGVARSGELLAASSNGEWTGNGDEILDYDYQWLADDEELEGETGTTISLTNAEIGLRISLEITAINSIGSTVAVSQKTAAVIAAEFMPAIVTGPVITGTAKSGETLTTSDGTWNNGGSTISGYEYAWFADDVLIDGETANTLELDDTHIGAVIRAEVTATNGVGSITATTLPTSAVLAAIGVPIILANPSYVLGSLSKLGKTLILDEGIWDPNGAETTITFQWLNHTDEDAEFVGETSTEIYFDEDWVPYIGDRIKCRVTATNSAGSTVFVTSSRTISNGDIPQNLSAPVISGVMYVGQVLSVSNGTWDPKDFPITSYTYQWQTWTPGGAGYADIDGATSNTYELVEADEGKRIRCYVFATNICGTRSKNTALAATVGPELEDIVNTVLPAISGTVKRNHTLSVTTGTWTASPAVASYTYQWFEDGEPIEGETTNELELTPEMVGAEITCEVEAYNGLIYETAISEAVGPVSAGDLPVNTVPPVISGILRVGFELSTTNGSWTADTPANPIEGYSYQWLADDVEIDGATSSTYLLTEDEDGAIITVEVSAKTDVGATPQLSDPTDEIEPFATAPINTVLPAVTPTDPDASTLLSASTGTWDDGGGTTPEYTYQWLAEGVDIEDATDSTFQLSGPYIGIAMSVRVTATNDVGNTSATSAETDPVSGSLEEETIAFVEAMSSEPDSTRKGVINTFVLALKNAGVWSKLDIIVLLAAHDSQAACINLIDPNKSFAEVGDGALTFTADEGFTGDGTNMLQYEDAFSTLANVQRTSATFGIYGMNSYGNSGNFICGGSGDIQLTVNPRTGVSSAFSTWFVVSSGDTGVAIDNPGMGFYCGRRTGDTRSGQKDGTIVLIGDKTPATESAWGVDLAQFPALLGRFSSRSQGKLSAGWFGSYLDDTETEALRSALNAYLTSIGAI